MSNSRAHALLPALQHDESARQSFVADFRRHLSTRVMPGNYQLYKRQVEPEFHQTHGRAPRDQHEIRKLMERESYYQFWSAMQRRSQELMWESVIEPTERSLPQLIDKSHRLALRAQQARRKSHGVQRAPRGSLRLDPKLVVPRYHTAADIHLQPGGYHTDYAEHDVAAGALYDAALPIYSNGTSGPENDSLGDILLQFYLQQFPGHSPLRLLDLGCAIGNSILPWARRFPDSEVQAIDVGAPVLRYAHARAESLSVAVHFSQQNAEHTDFESGSFDLVLSHIMLHETSRSALPNILRECHRLLRPGGIMLHLEIPRGRNALEKFLYNWETYNNNETFAGFMTDLDLQELAVTAGFDSQHALNRDFARPSDTGPSLYSEEFQWKILTARR